MCVLRRKHLTWIKTSRVSGYNYTAVGSPLRSSMLAVTGIALAVLMATASGCSSLVRNPVPSEQTAEARIPGMSDVRARGVG